jgi:hypothetical protein
MSIAAVDLLRWTQKSNEKSLGRAVRTLRAAEAGRATTKTTRRAALGATGRVAIAGLLRWTLKNDVRRLGREGRTLREHVAGKLSTMMKASTMTIPLAGATHATDETAAPEPPIRNN